MLPHNAAHWFERAAEHARGAQPTRLGPLPSFLKGSGRSSDEPTAVDLPRRMWARGASSGELTAGRQTGRYSRPSLTYLPFFSAGSQSCQTHAENREMPDRMHSPAASTQCNWRIIAAIPQTHLAPSVFGRGRPRSTTVASHRNSYSGQQYLRNRPSIFAHKQPRGMEPCSLPRSPLHAVPSHRPPSRLPYHSKLGARLAGRKLLCRFQGVLLVPYRDPSLPDPQYYSTAAPPRQRHDLR